MNRQEIRDRILQGLNEDTLSPVFYSLAEVNGWIDESLEVLGEEVADIRRVAYVPRRAGATYYTIHSVAPDIMAPYRVTLNEEDTRLLYTTIDDLDLTRQKWHEVTADAPDWWFPVSWDMFGIYPYPAESSGYLRVDYLAWPAALVDDLDEPEFSLEAHDACVAFGIAEGLLKQWDVVRALDYWTQFAALWRDRTGKTAANRLRGGIIHRMAVSQDSPTDLIGNP